MLSLFTGLAVIVAVAAILACARPSLAPMPRVAWLPPRAVTYFLALAALLTILFAAATLLAVGAALVTGQVGDTISPGDARDRASLAIAALIVALPLWLVFWAAAKRRLALSPSEQDAKERRLFLAAVFVVTSVVALFALQFVLQSVFTLPAPENQRPTLAGAIDAASRLVVYGAAWLAFARLGWRERAPRSVDAFHDLALATLALFSLGFLWHGLFDALQQMLGGLVGRSSTGDWSDLVRSNWSIWGEIAAWILSGATVWTAYLGYDLSLGGRRQIRVLYLYAVVLFAGWVTVIMATVTTFELFQRLFGYRPPFGDLWAFLADQLPWLLPAGLIWAVHWLIIRRQGTIDGQPREFARGITWPRRPALAIQVFCGLGMAGAGMLTMIWLAIDALWGPGVPYRAPDWWREQLCSGLAATCVGLALWLPAWLLLQRAAAALPMQERPARSRRVLLSGIVVTTGLAALGFAIAALWLLIRAVLGEGLDAAARVETLQYLCTALAAGSVCAAHGLVLREDRRWQIRRVSRLRVSVLVENGAGDMLSALSALPAVRVEIVGHLGEAQVLPGQDFHALAALLAELPDHDGPDGAVLVLGRTASTYYPYTKEAGAR